jgi:hypothetical protein
VGFEMAQKRTAAERDALAPSFTSCVSRDSVSETTAIVTVGGVPAGDTPSSSSGPNTGAATVLQRRRAPLGATAKDASVSITEQRIDSEEMEYVLLHQDGGNTHVTTSGRTLNKGMLYWLSCFVRKSEREGRMTTRLREQFGENALRYGRLPLGSPFPNRSSIYVGGVTPDEFLERFLLSHEIAYDDSGAVARVADIDKYGFDPGKFLINRIKYFALRNFEYH